MAGRRRANPPSAAQPSRCSGRALGLTREDHLCEPLLAVDRDRLFLFVCVAPQRAALEARCRAAEEARMEAERRLAVLSEQAQVCMAVCVCVSHRHVCACARGVGVARWGLGMAAGRGGRAGPVGWLVGRGRRPPAAARLWGPTQMGAGAKASQHVCARAARVSCRMCECVCGAQARVSGLEASLAAERQLSSQLQAQLQVSFPPHARAVPYTYTHALGAPAHAAFGTPDTPSVCNVPPTRPRRSCSACGRPLRRRRRRAARRRRRSRCLTRSTP
jgi:hypothetical protein